MIAVFHANSMWMSGVGARFRRKTGEVTRIMDRGTASIQNILSTGAVSSRLSLFGSAQWTNLASSLLHAVPGCTSSSMGETSRITDGSVKQQAYRHVQQLTANNACLCL